MFQRTACFHALIRRGRLDSIKAFGRLLLYRKEVENFEKGKPGPVSKNKR
jgi:hypothetical protein